MAGAFDIEVGRMPVSTVGTTVSEARKNGFRKCEVAWRFGTAKLRRSVIVYATHAVDHIRHILAIFAQCTFLRAHLTSYE